jgi:ABC-type branched-subunit amino acid transport system ATPase component
LQGRRIIEDMTVRENLRMGGYSRARDPGPDDYDRVFQ